MIARFDKATEQNLIGLAADAGIEGLDPHLTFGVYSAVSGNERGAYQPSGKRAPGRRVPTFRVV